LLAANHASEVDMIHHTARQSYRQRAIPLVLASFLILAVAASAEARSSTTSKPSRVSAGQRNSQFTNPYTPRRAAHRPGFQAAWEASVARLHRAFAPAWPPAGASGGWGPIPGSAPTIGVGGGPVGEVVDPSTRTLYVANTNDNTVSVINAATCNAIHTAGCDQIPTTVAVGSVPLALAVDQSTHTLYVANAGGNFVSMIDTAACNATYTAGCTQAPATVTVGSSPALLAINQATNTIYVPNSQADTVSVIDGATCNATDTSGCGHVSTLTVGSGAQAVALNLQTHTAYVANFNDGTVSVIDTATCNATVTSGCSQTSPTVAVGITPSAVVVDQASNTAYVAFGPGGNASTTLGSVALINGATCDATVTSGCARAPRTTPIGSIPGWITENPATRTVYAVNQDDSSVSVINAARCNASESAGCRQVAPALAIGFNGGAVAVDPSTNTVYATSQNENDVSVLDGSNCDATNTSGCTQFSPTTTVGTGPQGVAANPATHTIYVTNRTDDTVSVIDAATCNALDRAGCDRAWPTVRVGNYAQDIRVDERTDTIYVVNANDNTVSVINGATCNATISRGCTQTPPTIGVGPGPSALAIDQRTDTIYVANSGSTSPGDTISVINGATCNGTNTAGCKQTPPTIAVGNDPDGVAVDQRTDTIYVANGNDNTVSVINGASCNGTNVAGCRQTPPTITVGAGPYPVAVDQRTDTVYVGNTGDNTLSLINGASCNGTDMTNCGQTPAAVRVEGLPFGLAIDGWTRRVYITSIVDSDVQTINARTCNARTARACDAVPVPVRMGGWGGAIALDPLAGSAYVPDSVDGAVSIFGLTSL
jgi:YVTN family beta-propeller protein